MSDEATILHADADSFYASVEQRDDPSLRGRPVIVGGGVVLAASYEAKAFGVYTPMGETQARRLCPQAIVVRPRMEAYSEASTAMFEVFRDTTPLVEGLSIDEAFLDVGGLRRIAGTPDGDRRAPARGRPRARRDPGHRRRGAHEVPGEGREPGREARRPPASCPSTDELTFLHALPVERLWGVGPVTARKLRERSITMVADVARLDEAEPGADPRARGRPAPPRAGAQPRPAPGGGRPPATLDRHPAGARAAAALAGDARDRPARAGRPAGPTAARRAPRLPDGVLRLRFDDFARATRSHTLPEATGETATLLDVARILLTEALPLIRERGITLLGLTFTNLSRDDAVQLALPLDGVASSSAIDETLDRLHDRFGSSAVKRGVLLGRSEGLRVPLLPD